ncbi:amidohydrolase family protein [Streptomyces mirabilis]|uniref:amidohydrolase family protein n=1 Tax=Streptomyces mirabilis TaxID=68239 RepID=UPI0036E2A750
MAVAIAGDTGRSPLDVLDDFRALYFDTALSSSPAALPTLLAFARPGHVLFGSDWPFAPAPAPAPACQYFAGGLDTGVDRDLLQAVNRGNAEVLFSRLAASPRTHSGSSDRDTPAPGRPTGRRPPRLQTRPTRPIEQGPQAPPPGVRGRRGRRRHRRGVDGQTDEFFLGASPALHHEHCRICADANGRAADACREMLAAVRS